MPSPLGCGGREPGHRNGRRGLGTRLRADGTAKARHLHDLGISYSWALVANLAFSSLASCVFTWAVIRVCPPRRVRRRRATGEL